MHPSKKTKFINQHIRPIEKYASQFLTISNKRCKRGSFNVIQDSTMQFLSIRKL